MAIVLTLVIFLLASFHLTRCQVPKCCSMTAGSCRTACEQVSLVNVAINQEEKQEAEDKLSYLCSKLLVSFWNCINETFLEIEQGRGWYGRYCCHLPQSTKCRLACLRAQNSQELLQYCRHSDELSFYSCLERQDVGDRCCSDAKTSDCRLACKEVFTNSLIPNRQARDAALNSCSADNPNVMKCVRNYTHLVPAHNPSQSLHCCERSSLHQCRSICRKILRVHSTGQEILHSLINGGCGLPRLQDRLWQCFLTSTIKREYVTRAAVHHIGRDSIKLQCCYRAVTLRCQRLCIKIFSKEWDKYWKEFDSQCQYQLTEWEMLHCLLEVEEPCEIGCEGLSYCTKFNYRPTELFRNCDARADRAARNDVELWGKGTIRMPQMEIPVLDVSRCQPEKWKAIACMLQIKPCRKESYTNMICKSDCINILSQCLDYRRLLDGQSPATFCEMLSPPWENSSCLSLSSYLVDGQHVGSVTEVTHPCKRNPCNASEICLVNHDCQIGRICIPYRCEPGCRIGEMSQLMVREGSYVHIPSIAHHQECYVICQCRHHGTIDHCHTLYCSYDNSCTVNGNKLAHNTVFYDNCKLCICHAGEERCVNHCRTPKDISNKVLPCNCPNHYIPVCGINGKTYTSSCIARCMGLKENEFELGICSNIDPCAFNPCPTHQRCVPHKQFCFSIKHTSCKQYQCVTPKNCEKQQSSPVCDTEGTEHFNLCSLIEKAKTVAYFGHCISDCENTTKVCGYNGETYNSECAALADNVKIDYIGPCLAAQLVTLKKDCNMNCQPLPSKHCNKIYLPDSCCPVCGGVFWLAYSQRLFDRMMAVIKSEKPAKLNSVAVALLEHINVAECMVHVYPRQEWEITVIVTPSIKTPTALQVEACIHEAQKLQTLFEQSSPTVLTKVPLSAFIMAYTIEETIINNAGNKSSLHILVTIYISYIVLKLLFQRDLVVWQR